MYNISVSAIKNEIGDNGEGLAAVYRATKAFKDTMPDVWHACMDCVEHVLDKIIFANDVLEIPPTKTFLEFYKMMYPNKVTPNFKFDRVQSQQIGAFWGFVFQNCLKYERYKNSVQINTLGIKTASRFVKQHNEASWYDYVGTVKE
jgi:hypothetical protein